MLAKPDTQKGTYKTIECGCLESENGFIPNGDCLTHGTMLDVPVGIAPLTEEDVNELRAFYYPNGY